MIRDRLSHAGGQIPAVAGSDTPAGRTASHGQVAVDARGTVGGGQVAELIPDTARTDVVPRP